MLNLRRFVNWQFSRDVQILIVVSGLFSISFMGIQNLIKVLYLLRLGYGVEYVGLFSATGALAYMAMSLPSGALGSRFGARNTMLAGGIVTVVGLAILPFLEYVPSWLTNAWPIATQAVLSIGWSMYNVNLVPALMAMTTPYNRNDAYAMNSVSRGLGTFIGTISGGLLPGLFVYLLGQRIDNPAPYRLALWVAAVLGVVAVIPLTRVKPIERIAASEQNQPTGPFPTWPVALIVAHVYLSMGAWATCQTFCNAYMDTNLHLTAASIGLITGVGQFIAVLAPLLAPGLARRYNNGWTLMVTTLGIGISLLPLVLMPHWLAVGIGLLGMQILSAIWMPALQVFQMELVPSQWRTLAYGIVSMSMGFTFASVSVVGGYMAAAWGYRSLFLLGVGISILGAALMWNAAKQPKTRLNALPFVSKG